jgi:RNA polymerase sigma factor (sigma-70 family)
VSWHECCEFFRVVTACDVDRLIVDHLPLVDSIARRVYNGFRHATWSHRRISFDDVRSAGLVGLVEAAQRYEGTAGGASFAAYAKHRIHGAILDDLRLNAPLTRLQWQHVKDGRDTFFEEALSDRIAVAVDGPSTEVVALIAVDAHTVRRLMRGLTIRQRRVLQRFERGERKTDVADALGISLGRVVQLEAAAICRMRAMLAAAASVRRATDTRRRQGPLVVKPSVACVEHAPSIEPSPIDRQKLTATWANDAMRRRVAVAAGQRGGLAHK